MKGLRLLLVLSFLYSSCTCVSRGKEYEIFLKATQKTVSGQPVFKQAEEISAFVNSTPEDKKQWNNLARRYNEERQMLLNFYKTQNKRLEQESLFEKGIIQNTPEGREIGNELQPLRALSESAWKRYRSFDNNKVLPLEIKQAKLIEEAYKKTYGSEDMTLEEIEAVETKVKKTKKYKDLEKQLKPLRDQLELLYQEKASIDKKIEPLQKELEKIKAEFRESEDLPESLKNIARTIAQLKKQEEKLMAEGRKLEAIHEYQLIKQYKKMVKK